MLLLRGDQIYHIFCKQAVLEITISLLRGNQLTAAPSRLNTQERGPPRCTQTVAEITVLPQLGIAHFCLSTPSWLSLGAYQNCKPGDETFNLGLTTIWCCESMRHSQGSKVQLQCEQQQREPAEGAGSGLGDCCPAPEMLKGLREMIECCMTQWPLDCYKSPWK